MFKQVNVKQLHQHKLLVKTRILTENRRQLHSTRSNTADLVRWEVEEKLFYLVVVVGLEKVARPCHTLVKGGVVLCTHSTLH